MPIDDELKKEIIKEVHRAKYRVRRGSNKIYRNLKWLYF